MATIRHIIGGIILAAVFSSMAFAAPAPPTVQINVTQTPPTIDGRLDDACWDSAYQSPMFYDFVLGDRTYAPNPNTTLRVVTDGQWLYFGLECKHPTPRDMKATIEEHLGGRVWGDESIKFFIEPGMDEGGYIRYVLNTNNVHTISRSFSHDEAGPDWPAAVHVGDDGWSAEVAVPLFTMVGYSDLKDLRLNVFRKKILKEYDQYGVEVGFKESISSWSPTDDWLKSDDLGRIEGLDGLELSFPFVANVSDLSVGEVYDREEDGQVYYDVEMTLRAMTGHRGRAVIEVIETLLDGEQRTIQATFDLDPHEARRITVPVVVQAFGQRHIKVIVRDDETAMPFQTIPIQDASGFELLTAQSARNYYTDESEAQVVVSIGMPKSALADKQLVVRDTGGHVLARRRAPTPRGELAVPLQDVPNGSHVVEVLLETLDGRPLFGVDMELTKLSPSPGNEWKIDRSTGGTLLRDGEPFFPFGFLVDSADEARFSEIAEAGFNSVVWWTGGRDTPESFRDVVAMAKRHGLTVLVRPQRTPNYADQMATLKEYFTDEEYETAIPQFRTLLRLKIALAQPPSSQLTRQQRNRIAQDYVDVHLPAMLDNVAAVADMPNLIGYKTLDEPNFQGADLYVPLRTMYLRVKEADPYRPMFVLYSSTFPPTPEATSFADSLGTDPYWTPGRELPRGSINWVSIVTAKTVDRARNDGMMPWSIPKASLWGDTEKRMITPAEQICQTWLTLIHGTRGIWYFTYEWVATERQWQAMETLATRVNTITPALTASEPAQHITYAPGTWAPLKDEVPDVQASLRRFPDGRWLLLAANVRRSPVQIDVRVQGLEDERAIDLFKGEIGDVQAGAFTDTLAARDVRAYVFDRIDSDEPVRIGIDIRALGEEGVLETAHAPRSGPDVRNVMTNPSFEEATLEDWPDYLLPQLWRIGVQPRIGTPGAPAGLTTESPFHGDQCLFFTRSVPILKVMKRSAPQHETDQPYVLSFYARTDSDDPFELGIIGNGFQLANQSVTIEGKQWKRYSVRLTVPADMPSLPYFRIRPHVDNATVYLDAMQLERGLTPTEFQP